VTSSPERFAFTAHPWHGVPARGRREGSFQAFIELVPTDTVKYEIDKVTGHLRVDRPQLFSSLCPTLYGFIPRTFCGPRVAGRCSARASIEHIEGDGDPMDITVLSERPIAHGNVLVSARPIGGFRMIDGKQADDKIIAVLDADLEYGSLEDVAQCPAGVLQRLRHYFLNYKQAPDAPARQVEIAETYDRQEALEVIRLSELDYRERFGDEKP
jgi:inorganic pyrophosphatase